MADYPAPPLPSPPSTTRGELSAANYPGEMSLGTRKVIAEYNRQRQFVGQTRGEFEEANLRRIAVDTALKAPRYTCGGLRG
jgi:hypothetical protein